MKVEKRQLNQSRPSSLPFFQKLIEARIAISGGVDISEVPEYHLL